MRRFTARTARAHWPIDASAEGFESPQGPYADGGGEADTPQHCDRCSTFLENPLTEDGSTYVKGEIRAGDALAAWQDFYLVERDEVALQD